MIEATEQTTPQRISPMGVVVGVLVALLLIGWLIMGGGGRPLKPFHPTGTPGELIINGVPAIVTFAELNANPVVFRDQRIRITGNYAPQPKPDCFDFSGPDIRWALVSDDLQLNGLGFEEILALVPEGVTLTVEGIWHLYDGPLGCGKGPTREQIWYLQIERIVQPNPLPNFGPLPETAVTEPPTTPLPTAPPPNNEGTAVPTPTPSSQSTPTATATATPTPVATLTWPAGTTATPSSTPTTSNGLPTETPDSATTATTTPTPPAGATTPASTRTAYPTNSPVPTLPPLGTATPCTGYICPTATPTRLIITPGTPTLTPVSY